MSGKILLALILLCAFAARAGGSDASRAADPSALERPVDPAQAGKDPFARRGTFIETGPGLFATLGGSGGISDAQPFLGLALGRDVGAASAVFLRLGLGASRASCFDRRSVGSCAASDSFAATFLEVGLLVGVPVSERVHAALSILGGAAALSPSPVADARDRSVPDALFGPHLGLGAALDYCTRLDHFAVGIELAGRYALAPKPQGGAFGLPSVSLVPRVRYVF